MTDNDHELAKRAGRYKGRRADPKLHAQVIAMCSLGRSIAETAKLAGCSVAQVKRIWATRDVSQAESTRMGAFPENALTEADATAAADVEQGAAELPEPAFLDDEGPTEPPAHVSTARLRDILAGFTDVELAAWPSELSRGEIERRRRIASS